MLNSPTFIMFVIISLRIIDRFCFLNFNTMQFIPYNFVIVLFSLYTLSIYSNQNLAFVVFCLFVLSYESLKRALQILFLQTFEPLRFTCASWKQYIAEFGVLFIFLSNLGVSMRCNPFTFTVITDIFALVFITLFYKILLMIYSSFFCFDFFSFD